MAQGRIDKITCPSCKVENDGFTSLDDDDSKPSDNDISICFHCGAICKYTNNLTKLELIDVAELEDVRKTDPIAFRQLVMATDKIKKNKKVQDI